jgi:predicted DNA-binding protein YlxM (UPF0122 family)
MEEIHTDVPAGQLEARKQNRDEIDLLRSRLVLLDARDKVLMTMYLENGNSFRQIARLLGVSEATISRRVRTLSERLRDGAYIACLRNRSKLTRQQMDIAKDYFLTGLSIRQIAANRQQNYHDVRDTVRGIRSVVTATQLRTRQS